MFGRGKNVSDGGLRDEGEGREENKPISERIPLVPIILLLVLVYSKRNRIQSNMSARSSKKTARAKL
ncbi:hypothetical protein NECAME_07981 [Necator americanus]|uniref:Uncharacterized protein n=1 Tax=Necator americanus TaxID=51031 RepID=W2TL98_NECAM|nr:hypothetical protein NECAME_07981 [Necator americanus]ETN82404.1 hypothetical protein NECAME_07981 [Necator americanus]